MLRQLWGRSSQLCLRSNLVSRQSNSLYHSSSIRQARYVRFQYPPDPNPNTGGRNGRGKSFFEDRTWPIKVGVGLAGVGVIYYVSCLEQVPETGRWRFMAVSPQSEADLGSQVLQQTLHEFQGRILPENHVLSRHVKKVVQNVLDASQLGTVKGYTQSQASMSNFASDDDWSSPSSTKAPPSAIAAPNKEWTVLVVDDRTIVNAAAAPGTVIVFTGILPVCRDEQGLAAVLSHEIGHVVARHSAERLSSQSIYIALGLFLWGVLGVDMGITALMNKILLELPNSRLQEMEADLIGLRLMSKACYDPKASPEMFTRLGQLERKASGGFRSAEFLNTHPSSDSRVKELETHISEAYALVAANPLCAQIQDQAQAFREKTGMRNVFDVNISRDGGHHGHDSGEGEEVWR